jgi:anti-anti-sigma factor
LGRILDRRPRGLVFDLAGVRYLDCAAARTIVGTGRVLPAGQRPVLRHPRPMVRRLLSVTGLDERCIVEPDVQ